MSTIYGSTTANRRPTTRTWLAFGAAAAAVAMLVMIIAVACSGSKDQDPLAADTIPTPSASPEPVEPGSEEAGSGPGAAGPGGTGGQAPGGDGPGGDPPGGDPPGGGPPGGDDPDGDGTDEVIPVFPIPLQPTISATLHQPANGCVLTGTITVGGFLAAPLEVEYQWLRIGKFGLDNEPLSTVQTMEFDKAGDKSLILFPPKNDVEHAVQLRIYGEETIYSNLVAYQCS